MSTRVSTALTPNEVKALDPYLLMAVVGERVIHPGGRISTEELIQRADFQVSTGSLDMLTPTGFLTDEGLANTIRMMIRTLSRWGYVQKMAWLMPQMMHAVPYLGYVPIVGTKPARI